MRLSRSLLLLVAGLGLGLAPRPAAAIDGDTQLWNTQNFNFTVDSKWSANFEVQERWYGDISYFSLFIVRPSITYKWNDRLSFTAGYGHFRSYDEDGRFQDENRIFQQAAIRLFGGKDQPALTWRTRLEQRFFDGTNEPTWRLREQLRFTLPLVERVQGVYWTEAYWRLNTTERAESGLEQWRHFTGLNFEIHKKFTFEAGYMNVHTWRARGDTMDHVPWLISTIKF